MFTIRNAGGVALGLTGNDLVVAHAGVQAACWSCSSCPSSSAGSTTT